MTLYMHQLSYSKSNKQSTISWGDWCGTLSIEAASQGEVAPKLQKSEKYDSVHTQTLNSEK